MEEWEKWHKFKDEYFKDWDRIPTKYEVFEAKRAYKQTNTNMKKQSKVKSVQANGTWESSFGLMYKFDYELEDGTSLTAQHKTPDHYKEGEEVEYEVKGENAYGKYGKVSKPQEQGYTPQAQGGAKRNTDNFILYQVCLKGAMDYYIQNSRPEFENVFTPEAINDLALQIAQGAKANIEKL